MTKILGAAIGNCVHVGGINSFLELAKGMGYEVELLGPAVPIRQLVSAIKLKNPEIVAVSYRLTPESAAPLLGELKLELEKDQGLKGRRYLFGGTAPVAVVARNSGIFEAVFDGSESVEAIKAKLRGAPPPKEETARSSDLVDRIKNSYPLPLLRHHFGLPKMKDTIEGARMIAESGALDILSLAPDQNAQESFFRPSEMDPKLDGAGGAPFRRREDLRVIWDATRRGNYPLLRCYSGTRDLIKWAEMLKETINIAWGAVPIMWYSELDGRSKRPLREAIAENQEAIRWYAQNDVPVEINESHQWALRGCGDTIELAMAYVAAYNARAFGVRDYVCQFMFDTPRGIAPAMDLAKMLAKLELVESLADGTFRVVRMVRSGLASLPPSQNEAKGQLAASIYSAMSLSPHIVHVVGFSEADHVATAPDIIESCQIAKGAVAKALLGMPKPEADPKIAARKAQLLEETKFLIEAIKRGGSRQVKEPLTSPEVLFLAVKRGLLDAPDLKGNPVALGSITTAIVNGACVVVDRASNLPILEKDRVARLAASEEDLDLAEI
ncbi:MAG: cobalamin-dependent protein [Candidatus Thermoplasmatota archaeon]|nr:cobalamin-dependent protein [Candidatus Thermoplasmatota archaeon]